MDATGTPEACARQIAETPALLAEAQAALPMLRAVAIAKAGEDGVRRVIAKRFETYPQPQRSDEGWAAWWADYFDVLAEVGLASLEAAMRAYVGLPDSEFMPKPGRLWELTKVTPCRSLQRYQRARRAAELALEDRPVAERADPAAVKALLEDFRTGQVKRQIPERQMPYTGGVPDEHGITPEMREIMARRAGE